MPPTEDIDSDEIDSSDRLVHLDDEDCVVYIESPQHDKTKGTFVCVNDPPAEVLIPSHWRLMPLNCEVKLEGSVKGSKGQGIEVWNFKFVTDANQKIPRGSSLG